MIPKLKYIKKISTILFSIAIALVLSFNLVMAQQDLEKVEIKTIPLRENIYMLVGDGGNIGIKTGEDGVFLIDAQMAAVTDKIVTAIKQISDQPIRFLMNTHYHFDHTGGNENFAKLGVTIIAQDNVSKQMSMAHNYEILGMKIPVSNKQALPKITFSKTSNLDINNSKIHAFHLPPGHTDGDTVIHFQKENVIHTGDIYFNGIYPFIDLEVGGSLEGMIASVNSILPLCDDQTLIIPGHGALSNRKELIEYKNMLETVNNKVKKAKAEGMSLEQFIKSKPTEEFDEKWGKGFLKPEQFSTLIYNVQTD